MGIQISCCQLHGLAQHDAEGDVGDMEVSSHTERLADVVAVLHKGLLGKVGIEALEEPLALGSAVDDHAVST